MYVSFAGHSNMKLMESIEDHIGEPDFWPSYLLIYIFADHPSPVATSRLKKVIAFFFFGNDIPCELACKFYQACNGTVSRFVAVSRFVNEQFQEWYGVWQRSQNKFHMAYVYQWFAL
jgi:hypothetical protein